MLTVHHLENSRSQRILWLLEELELDYEIVHYARHPETMLAPPELAEVHPLGKSPVVTDGDKTLAESGAVIEYIVDTYDEDHLLRPERGTPEFLNYRYWLHYAEGSAMSPFLLKLIFDRLPQESPLLVRPVVGFISKAVMAEFVNPRIQLHLDFWESELAERKYFAGDAFTAADIQMSFALDAAMARSETRRYPRVRAHHDRLHARAAYQRALERGGSYELAF